MKFRSCVVVLAVVVGVVGLPAHAGADPAPPDTSHHKIATRLSNAAHRYARISSDLVATGTTPEDAVRVGADGDTAAAVARPKGQEAVGDVVGCAKVRWPKDN